MIETAQRIYNIVQQALYEIRRSNNKPVVENQNPQNNPQQIKDLKEVLDMEAITQEEFDTKKNQLLNL